MTTKNPMPKSTKIIPASVQARIWGVTVEQAKAQCLRCAKATVEMHAAALKLEAQGKKHNSGMTAAELNNQAFSMFLAAHS